jgi:hypothetical protein
MDDLSAEEYKISDDMEVDVSKEKSTEKEVCIRGEENKSKWLQLMETGLVVEAHHLCSAEHRAEFACLHNRDSHNFMNVDKFERFILKKNQSYCAIWLGSIG